MTERELRKLSRKELLELLLIQTSRADELEAQLNETREQLKKREILEMEAGTMAEAALKINGVFEAVDAAAAQYLQNIKRISKLLEDRVLNHDNTNESLLTEAVSGPGWMNLLFNEENCDQ